MGAERYEETVRRMAHRNGYRMMHRRNGQYWLIAHTPMKLEESPSGSIGHPRNTEKGPLSRPFF
jgi:hypothetical protein